MKNDNQRMIQEAWTLLISKNIVKPDHVRREIYQSWLRCKYKNISYKPLKLDNDVEKPKLPLHINLDFKQFKIKYIYKLNQQLEANCILSSSIEILEDIDYLYSFDENVIGTNAAALIDLSHNNAVTYTSKNENYNEALKDLDTVCVFIDSCLYLIICEDYKIVLSDLVTIENLLKNEKWDRPETRLELDQPEVEETQASWSEAIHEHTFPLIILFNSDKGTVEINVMLKDFKYNNITLFSIYSADDLMQVDQYIRYTPDRLTLVAFESQVSLDTISMFMKKNNLINFSLLIYSRLIEDDSFGRLLDKVIKVDSIEDLKVILDSIKLERTLDLRAEDLRLETIKDAELRAIEVALDKFEGNVSKAANYLKISRTTLYRKLRLLGK